MPWPVSTAVPAPDASVRRAGPNDAPAVGAVQAAVWTQAYATHLPDEVLAAFTPAAFGTAWRASLTRPPAGIHQLLVALTGARIVGFVALGPAQDPDADADQAEITAIGVHPGARGEGHGSRLLNAAVDVLREAGATAVSTWVLTDHDDVRRFLAGSGFSPDGAHRERVVAPDGRTLREVRLVVVIGPPASEPS